MVFPQMSRLRTLPRPGVPWHWRGNRLFPLTRPPYPLSPRNHGSRIPPKASDLKDRSTSLNATKSRRPRLTAAPRRGLMGNQRPTRPMAPALPLLPARAEIPSARSATALGGPAPGILVLQAQGMGDGRRAIAAVRGGQSVILDASSLDPAVGQRLVDYTCGGVQAMDGQSRRLGDAVFLFTSGLSEIEYGAALI